MSKLYKLPVKRAMQEDGSGYRKPPKATQFRKGQSGNPKGRPQGRHREAPYEAVLGQMVTVREDGAERQVTAAEAFYLQLAKRGLEGNTAAARATTAAIEEGRQRSAGKQRQQPPNIVVVAVAAGSVTRALESLRMAKKLDPYRPAARMALEPWIVEAALARLGDKRLSVDEQNVVIKATRTPQKVNWPSWWEVLT